MKILHALWQDQQGGLVAAEYLLLGTLLTIGLMVGIAAVQERSWIAWQLWPF